MQKATRLKSIAGLSASAMLAATAVTAEVEDTVRVQTTISGDASLTTVLAETDAAIQTRNTRDAVLAQILTPHAPDYDSKLVALRGTFTDAPAPADMPQDFALAVLDDGSLTEKVGEIQSGLRDDRFNLYVELARLAEDQALEDWFDTAAESSSFGPSISGDTTLNAKMAHIVDLMAEDKASVILSAVDTASFDDRQLERSIQAVTAIAD